MAIGHNVQVRKIMQFMIEAQLDYGGDQGALLIPADVRAVVITALRMIFLVWFYYLRIGNS
jgi:hypothetical protein